MAVLSYNEITPKKVILFDDEPYQVLSSHVFRKQQRKPVNITKLKSLKSGRVVEQTFHQNETVSEADLETRSVTYVFSKGDQHTFHTTGDRSDRFALSTDLIGEQVRFLKNGMEIDALVWGEEIIGLKFPIKVELTVTEAMPAVKGDTAQGAQKDVTLETGAVIQAPMFINEGDVLSINTETGQYSERVRKA